MAFRYLLGDTETSGFGDKSGVCELAWVEIDENLAIIDSQHSLIDPQVAISASASGVHGLTDADVADAPTMDEFFEYVYGKRLTGDVVLMAHNVAFDKRYFAPYIDTMAGELCTLRLARQYFPEAPDHKLATLKFFLNLDSGTSHRADGDVRTTLDLLRRIVERSGKTLPELVLQTAEPIFVHTMTFGVHKGKPIREVPKEYLSWLRRKADLDSDLKYTIQQLAKEGVC